MSRRTLKLPSWLPIDPYILALIGTVAVAALLPASGAAADVAGGASTGAVALLFFLYGARLSTAEALDGLKHWRLHLTVLICTFVAFPLLGLAGESLVPYVLTPQLYSGFLFLCLVPSTIQSSIAFTSIARGNVPHGDLRGLLLLARRNLPHPAARRRGARQQRWRILGGRTAEDRGPATAAVRRRAAAAPLDRRVHHPPQEGARLCRPGLDPAGRLHRVQ